MAGSSAHLLIIEGFLKVSHPARGSVQCLPVVHFIPFVSDQIDIRRSEYA